MSGSRRFISSSILPKALKSVPHTLCKQIHRLMVLIAVCITSSAMMASPFFHQDQLLYTLTSISTRAMADEHMRQRFAD